MGTNDMLSTPPATIASALPARMRSTAKAMACRPDAQKRLTVIAEHSNGRPGTKARGARDVQALLGLGHGAAQDDVFDNEPVELRDALQRSVDGEGGEVVGTRGAQRSPRRLADGGADRRCDDGVLHLEAS